METLELTTEFGTLNFEDIAEEITEAPVKEPEIVIENDSEFEKEMEKVIGIMKNCRGWFTCEYNKNSNDRSCA